MCRCGDFSKSGEELLTSRHPHKWNDITPFSRKSRKVETSEMFKQLLCMWLHRQLGMATSWYDTCMEDMDALFQRFHGCKHCFSIHATLLLHACSPSVCWHTTHILPHAQCVRTYVCTYTIAFHMYMYMRVLPSQDGNTEVGGHVCLSFATRLWRMYVCMYVHIRCTYMYVTS